jgi:ATP-dependent DNA helicase HFM1/MER3
VLSFVDLCCVNSTLDTTHIHITTQVDEIHLIADETRGATLEATVCRMKSISSICQQQQGFRVESEKLLPLRIVGVSATVPNIADLGEWIGAPTCNVCAFGAEFRPVPLTVQAISGGSKFTNEFVFDRGLNVRIPDLLRQHSNGRPALVFCATRASTSSAATQLARESAAQLISSMQRQLLHLKVNFDVLRCALIRSCVCDRL